MEYHSNRFHDHSLLFFTNGKLVALLPANVRKDTLFSHEGLTFGGVISNYSMNTLLMGEVFRELMEHCKEEGIKRIVYKAIPYIYHSIPADEDLYTIFRHNGHLIARNVSSCIYIPKKRKFDRNRLRTINVAKKNSLTVKRSFDFRGFMDIAESVIRARHGVMPVHTFEEIKLLADRFPDNIKLFASYKGEKMLAGVIIYESQNVAHGQYAANSDEGWLVGAEDAIIDYLINDYYKDKRYFDFGISTENFGQVLNIGLISYKEDFGACPIMYDSYQLTL